MKKNKNIYRGIIPFINNISDYEINKVIKKYRKLNPKDKSTDEDLRPFAVNTILKIKNPDQS